MSERKIMIEVTEEEYEKIKNGQLEIDLDEVRKKAIEEMDTEDLIYRLIHYRINSIQTFVRDPRSGKDYLVTTGKCVLSDDSQFEFSLKTFNK